MQQLNIFDNYKITKPIRLIEFFAGIGAQAKALKNLGVNFEHHRICEWAVPSILAYNEIHQDELSDYGVDFSQGKSKDDIINFLFERGISSNYNEPMKFESIKRMPEKKLRNVYNAIRSTHNMVNIQKTNGSDLGIVDVDKYEYILTYSFPCQDLSVAGKCAGMDKGSGTRSGMLWEVERILKECNEIGSLPQVLLMENVPQVCGKKNLENFTYWQEELEKLGYTNFYEILNAKDYGIPQNRKRCFMVSILGDYGYQFPEKQELKLKLKDMLEESVDEKYYLSDSMINYISQVGSGNYQNKDCKINLDVARPLTTCQNKRAGTTNYIGDGLPENFDTVKGVGNYSPSGHNASRVVDEDGIAPTVMGNHGTVTGVVRKYDVEVKENQYSEYSMRKIAENIVDGDVCGTITASAMQSFNHDNCHLVVEDDSYVTKKYKKFIDENGYIPDIFCPYNDVEVKDVAKTITTQCGSATSSASHLIKEESVFTETEKQLFTDDGNIKRYINSDIIDKFEDGQMATTTFPNGYGHGPRTHDMSVSLNTVDKPAVKYGVRIRKLTPKECYRLMGFSDLDWSRASSVISDSMLYHTSGDSIVVPVIERILEQMLKGE